MPHCTVRACKVRKTALFPKNFSVKNFSFRLGFTASQTSAFFHTNVRHEGVRARPRGWAHWNRPRVFGQGVRGYPPSCRAPRAACGLKRPKRKKGGLRSQYIFEPAKHRRAPPPGHARPRGWAWWNQPRVVGQGASGCTPSCRAPPRVACGPKIKKGSERVRAVQRC